MKKAIALSFILLANMIILAHAVVPHHDHDDMTICFFGSHCDDCNVTHNPTECETHTHHDHTCSDKCCTIDNIFDPTDNKAKAIYHIHANCDCWQTLYFLTLNIVDIQDCIDDTLLLFLHAPYIDTCHTDYVSQSLGLRAPPAC